MKTKKLRGKNILDLPAKKDYDNHSIHASFPFGNTEYALRREGELKEQAKVECNTHNKLIDLIAEQEVKLSLDEEKLNSIIKDYFGYKDIAEPVYNIRYGCSLAQALKAKASDIIVKEEIG